MKHPQVIDTLREGAALDDLAAAAAQLWLGAEGQSADPDGSLRQAVAAYWRSRPGADPYWDFLGKRGACSTCGERYRFENLSICPNCLKTFCYRDKERCACGFKPVG